ncbi:MAG: DUF692 family protein [Candidatus Thiodiazotropha sp. (ex Dulcina madagascariensis)]|nr:DUF692 family protein [Candidatus Thiodiazotropha sp. (ex Dulcina madagascariensis)]
MHLGINWTSAASENVIRNLLENGDADFCELLLDNFIHLKPSSVREALGDVPVSFHIMRSRFLERDKDNLLQIAKRIRLWIDQLNPIYISDHLAQFTIDGRTLPLLAELNYDTCYPDVRDRVLFWQDILHSTILFENFPSTLDTDGRQVDFYTNLLEETSCGLLFDISNSVIAELNCDAKTAQWLPLVSNNHNFHIAGYRTTDGTPQLAIDTHDVPVSEKSFSFSKEVLLSSHTDDFQKTLVLERDANINYNSWADDLHKLRTIHG